MIVCEVKVEMGWRRGKGKPPLGGGILLIFDIRFSPSCLKFSAKGSVLEARKEPVQLGQRSALGGFQLFYCGDAAGEFALLTHRRKRDQKALDLVKVEIGNADTFNAAVSLVFYGRSCHGSV